MLEQYIPDLHIFERPKNPVFRPDSSQIISSFMPKNTQQLTIYISYWNKNMKKFPLNRIKIFTTKTNKNKK